MQDFLLYSCVGKNLLSDFWTTALVEVIFIASSWFLFAKEYAPQVVLSLC